MAKRLFGSVGWLLNEETGLRIEHLSSTYLSLHSSINPSTIVQDISGRRFTFLISTIIIYFLGWAIYNLYFSPLAKYPGPFFAKVSGIPSWYHAVKGNRHIWIWQCHQIYGDTFRFRPNGVIVNSPSGFRSIYGHKVNVQKSSFYDAFPRDEEARSTLHTIDKTVHARKRRILNGVFSEVALKSAESFVTKHVDRWCQVLIQSTECDDWSEPKNLSQEVDYLVFDILGDLCFGRSFETKEPGDNPYKIIPHGISLYLKFTNSMARSPFVNLWVWLKPRGVEYLIDLFKPLARQRFTSFIAESVTDRTKLEVEQNMKGSDELGMRKDMFHYLYQAKDPETGGPAYTLKTLVPEAVLLIIAGTDTTSITMSAVFFYLTHYSRTYEKLTKEIRSTFKSVDEIQGGPKLASCQYLRACIDEALRMSPSVPSEPPREVLSGGLIVDGQYLPKGTEVGTSNWSLHHNDEIFGDPWVFRPERWIIDETTGVTGGDVARAQSAFYPFSRGTGDCAGKRLAMQELLITVGRTLFIMDVRALSGNTVGAGSPELGWGRRSKLNFQIKDVYTAVRDGPVVQFKRRKI